MLGGDGMDSSTRVHVCQVCVGSCSHIISCQALSVAASWGLGASNAYPLPKSPTLVDRTPEPCPGSRREAGWVDMWQNPVCPRLS
jgi:hypothetical protein